MNFHRLLIQSGANVNAVDKDGWTPLHAAAHWEQEETCRILAENGSSFEIRNYSVINKTLKPNGFF
jgi:protein phosphatase 1 regulatory subunit 12A